MKYQSRKEVLHSLNSGDLSLHKFETYDQINKYQKGSSLGGYLLALVFDTYSFLFQQQDFYNKHHDYNTEIQKSFSAVEKAFGSSDLTTFIKLYSFCRLSGINPTYYLATLFSYQLYVSRNSLKLMQPLEPRNLQDCYSIYRNAYMYDKLYYEKFNNQSHYSIYYAENYTIKFSNYFFKNFHSGLKIQQVVQESKQKYLSYVGSFASMGQLKNSVQQSTQYLNNAVDIAFCQSYLNYVQQTKDTESLLNFSALLWGINDLPLMYLLDKGFLLSNKWLFNFNNCLSQPVTGYSFLFGQHNLQVASQKDHTFIKSKMPLYLKNHWYYLFNVDKLVNWLLQTILATQRTDQIQDNEIITKKGYLNLTKFKKKYQN